MINVSILNLKIKEKKMSRTNCKNCGAALDIFAPKCAFCGTKNINMTDIDLSSGEAANFIFKLPKNIVGSDGQAVVLSMLAIPELEEMNLTNETTDINGGWDSAPISVVSNYSFELGINLRAVNSPISLTIK